MTPADRVAHLFRVRCDIDSAVQETEYWRSEEKKLVEEMLAAGELCPRCVGHGYITLPAEFDVRGFEEYQQCPDCHGQPFLKESA